MSGDQFASALTSVGNGTIHRPTVVTVASCDSGNVGTVVLPGASFAHALHQAGVALVVASQFPLSKQGSVPLAASLYEGLLWGEHPLVLLQQLRAELHARYTASWHDWASLVVYEAIPFALKEQLDCLRYVQSKRAIDVALDRSDRAVRDPASCTTESLAGIDSALDRAVGRLPTRDSSRSSVSDCAPASASGERKRAFCTGRGRRLTRLAGWEASFGLLERGAASTTNGRSGGCS